MAPAKPTYHPQSLAGSGKIIILPASPRPFDAKPVSKTTVPSKYRPLCYAAQTANKCSAATSSTDKSTNTTTGQEISAGVDFVSGTEKCAQATRQQWLQICIDCGTEKDLSTFSRKQRDRARDQRVWETWALQRALDTQRHNITATLRCKDCNFNLPRDEVSLKQQQRNMQERH